MEKIISIHYDKVRKKDVFISEGDGSPVVVDRGEYIKMQVFSVGILSQTPSGEMDIVSSIVQFKDKWIGYDITFKNGEKWRVYPIPPFDLGYETIKEEDGQGNNKD